MMSLRIAPARQNMVRAMSCGESSWAAVPCSAVQCRGASLAARCTLPTAPTLRGAARSERSLWVVYPQGRLVRAGRRVSGTGWCASRLTFSCCQVKV
jgi:hypothetical protein